MIKLAVKLTAIMMCCGVFMQALNAQPFVRPSQAFNKLGIEAPVFVAMTHNGESVYVASLHDFAITHFSRDPVSGDLDYAGMTVRGIDFPDIRSLRHLEISADDRFMYVATSSGNIILLAIMPDGSLQHIQTLAEGADVPDGLSGLSAVTISPDGSFLYSASISDNAITLFDRDQQTGLLTYRENYFDGVEGIDGIEATYAIAFDSDGEYLYATGQDDSAIAVFERDIQTGSLTFIEAHFDSDPGIESFNSPTMLKVTQDGRQVYVMALDSGAIVRFDRNPATGTLTYADAISRQDVGNQGLSGASSLQISASDEFIYTGNFNSSSIGVFQRDLLTGELTFLEAESDTINSPATTFGPAVITLTPDGEQLLGVAIDSSSLFTMDVLGNGELEYQTSIVNDAGYIDNFDFPNHLVFDRTGRYLFVANQNSDSLSVLEKHPGNGRLREINSLQEKNAGSPLFDLITASAIDGNNSHLYLTDFGAGVVITVDISNPESPMVESLTSAPGGVRDIALSADGKFAYIPNSNDDSLRVFARDQATGALSLVETYVDGVNGIDNLNAAYTVALSLSGDYLYLGALGDSAITLFSRDTDSGLLNPITAYVDGDAGTDGLVGLVDIEISQDGRHLYSAGRNDNAIAVFSIDENSGELAFIRSYSLSDGLQLQGVMDVSLTADADMLMASGRLSDAVVFFARDSMTGELSVLQTVSEQATGIFALDTPSLVLPGSEGNFFYSGSQAEQAVQIFELHDRLRASGFEESW